jgi:pimeloyl-ACP methyl ester carboxylesterase
MHPARSTLLRLSVTLAVPLFAVAAADTAHAACDPDRFQASGAVYRICMPDPGRWNGDLLIWAHGYVDFTKPIAIPEDQLHLPDGTSLASLVNGLGYAFATTSYSVNGLAVRQGLADVVDLVSIFQSTKGVAKHTYLVGASEGGLITALGVEQRPDVFTGGLATCGPIGDFTKQLGYFGDFRVTFDYLYPGLLPGDPNHVPPDLIANWDTYYASVVAPTIFAPANQDRTAQLIRVANVPFDPQNVAPTVAKSLGDALWYNVFATNDAIDKIGGPFFDNTRRLYVGSNNDLLLNLRVRRLRAEPAALAEIHAHYDTTGVLRRPLVTLHTLRDQQVPAWHEALYALKALSRGSADKLVSIPIDRYGHCNFTPAEVLVGFSVLVFKAEHRLLVPQIQTLLPPPGRTEFTGLARQQGLTQ